MTKRPANKTPRKRVAPVVRPLARRARVESHAWPTSARPAIEAFARAVTSSPEISTALREVHPEAAGRFKDVCSLGFLGLLADLPEAGLQRGLLRHLGRLLTELGRFFCFLGWKRPIQVGNQDFIIDPVFCT